MNGKAERETPKRRRTRWAAGGVDVCILVMAIIACKTEPEPEGTPSPIPDAPVPIVTPMDSALMVRWDEVANAETYEVRLGKTGVFEKAEKKDETGKPITIFTGLTNGTRYYVWVTAKNQSGGSKQSTSVSAIPHNTGAKEITLFKIGGAEGEIDETRTPKTISVTVPYGTGLTSLAPEIVTTGAMIIPASGTAQNFAGSAANPVTYTVIAEDGSWEEYRVTVQAEDSGAISTTVSLTVLLEEPIPLSPAALTIYKEGNPSEVALTAPDGYTRYEWFVDGIHCGDTQSLTIKALNYTTGPHTVTVMVYKNSIPYSKELTITVALR